jgi:tRNA pseudouridine38-40 synthase
METYKSIVTYDGSGFHGFQRQREDIRTVQGVLERALRELGWRGESLLAAGRTDAGVHARGQVIAFELNWSHGGERLTKAMNAHLPQDVAVTSTDVAPEGFHPRFDAAGRQYSYRAIAAPVRDPLQERYAWRVWPEPDGDVLRASAEALIGRYDFRAFGRAPIPDGHTVRQIIRAEWRRERSGYVFTIAADAFLHRMVRRLVGAMMEAGLGRVRMQDLIELRDHPDQRWQGMLAPARGLCLDVVWFDKTRASAPDEDDTME